jgi:hypothetical protein
MQRLIYILLDRSSVWFFPAKGLSSVGWENLRVAVAESTVAIAWRSTSVVIDLLLARRYNRLVCFGVENGKKFSLAPLIT